MYDKVVAKVNNIGTSDFVLKTNFNTKFTGLENKILIVMILLKRLITMLKLLKQKIKFLILVGQQQKLH